jgi:putative transposase
MPRKIVPLVTGEVYHVFNRGTEKRNIFLDKEDYVRFYRSLLLFNQVEPVINFSFASLHESDILTSKALVSIHAYSLLPNHYHLFLEQLTDGGLSEFLKRLSGGYTSYFNEKYERSGVLFQGKYKRVHVEGDDQYRYLFAYVNENHFVHGIKRPDEIVYSSSLHYSGNMRSTIIASKEVYNTKTLQALAHEVYKQRLLEKMVMHE